GAGMTSEPPGRRHRTTVLLVDDHPVVREGLRGMIDAEHDLTVVGEADSGAEAIAMAESLCPDVILMDLRMPDVDGVTATDGRGPPRSLCAPPISVALSAREVEVLSQVVAKGSTNAEIGRLLHIS